MLTSRYGVGYILLAIVAFSGMVNAHATTIDTYDFTQDNYQISGNTSPPGVLTGSFTGAVEPSGFIELTDLSSSNVVLTLGMVVIHFGSASFFSFDTVGGASSLDLIAETDLSVACVGAVAEFGFGNCGIGGVNGFAANLTTQSLPTVMLVSSVTTVPEPPTWLAMLIGVLGLGLPTGRGARPYRGPSGH